MTRGRRQEAWVNGLHFNAMEDVYEEVGCTTLGQRKEVRRCLTEGIPYHNLGGVEFILTLANPAPRKEPRPERVHVPGTPLFSPCRHRLGCSEAGV